VFVKEDGNDDDYLIQRDRVMVALFFLFCRKRRHPGPAFPTAGVYSESPVQ